MEKQMLLSISLLCSGREKTTERTLASIKKIIDKIGNSEIVVVDTGCDEKTRNIVQKYADKIISFEWCNDFSAARNVGVDASSGEWFMFIDDDEWFEDPTPIINFFTSGNHQNYTQATYKVRNYANFEGTRYDDSINGRIFKTNDKKNNRFVGKVHEYFVPVNGPIFNIDCHAEHYGYVFLSDEDRRKHSLRNISLLREMYESNPEEIRWAQQLVPEYYGLEEYIQMNDICTTTLSKFKEKDEKRINTIRPIFYISLIRGYIGLSDYDSAIDSFENSISDLRNSDIAMARLYEIGARLYWDAKRDYVNIIELTKNFLEIFCNPNTKDYLSENSVFSIRDAFEPTFANEIIILGTVSAIYRNQVTDAISFFNELVWEDENKRIRIPAEIIDIYDAIAVADYNENLLPIITDLAENPSTEQLVLQRVYSLVENNNDCEKIFARYGRIAQSDCRTFTYLKILDAIHENNLYDNISLLQNYINDSSSPFNEGHLWDKIETLDIDKSICLSKIDSRRFSSLVDSYVKNLDLDETFSAIKRFDDCFVTNNYKYDYLQLKLYEGILTKSPIESWDSFDELIEAISIWSQVAVGYYSIFVKDEFLFDECTVVDNASQVALNMHLFLQCATLDFRQAFAIIKSSIGIYTPLDDLLNLFAKLYADFYKSLLV